MLYISKMFDKESMDDAIITCYNRGVDLKAIRIWYELNNNTRIQVKTGVGMSGYGCVGPVVGQGTLGGAIVSQAVLDEGVSEHFIPGGEDELQYGSVPIAPFMYQDDLIHGVIGIEQGRRGNIKMDKMIKQRGWTLNDKNLFVLLWAPKNRKQMFRSN